MYKRISADGNCIFLLPYTKVVCHYSYLCDCCEVYYRFKRIKMNECLDVKDLFGWRDVLGTTPKSGGADWYRRSVVLKPEAMRNKGITVNLINQVFYAKDGSGVFKHNPSGMIDGYLCADPKKEYTFFRNDFYGVISDSAKKRYEGLYGIKLLS